MLASLAENQSVLAGIGNDGARSLIGMPSSQVAEKVLVVGVSFGVPSRRALRRAAALARERGYALRLVHASPEGSQEPLRSALCTDRQDWMNQAKAAVQAWAALLAGIVVPVTQIRVISGSPQEALLQEAARPGVDLVVLGRSERSSPDPQDTLAHRLLRSCPRPMLVVGEHGMRPVIIAATDCTDARLPVLRRAASLMPALGEKVVAVHNLDREASQRASRLGVSLTPQLAAMLSSPLQEWLDESEGQSELLITQHAENAEGVLGAARAQAADLIAVGVRPGREKHQGTAESLLDKCHLSILSVPVGRLQQAA